MDDAEIIDRIPYPSHEQIMQWHQRWVETYPATSPLQTLSQYIAHTVVMWLRDPDAEEGQVSVPRPKATRLVQLPGGSWVNPDKVDFLLCVTGEKPYAKMHLGKAALCISIGEGEDPQALLDDCAQVINGAE